LEVDPKDDEGGRREEDRRLGLPHMVLLRMSNVALAARGDNRSKG
jgi:hypothetical protein